MNYSQFVELYESLAKTPSRLEKTTILAKFLKKLPKENPEYIYLLKGKVFPDYDSREFGISGQLTLKAISKTSGATTEILINEFRKTGDIGLLAQKFIGKKKQSTLFTSTLKVKKIFENLQKLVTIEGHGSQDKKLALIIELFNSATGKEAKYIARTLLSDLKIGVAEGVIRDSIAKRFFPKQSMSPLIESAYDLANDYAEVFNAAKKGPLALKKISITPGRPMKVMLPIKVTDIKEAFRICGTPAAIEHKYDGFRVLINKSPSGDISLFTRRLENVTNQFPDIVKTVGLFIKAKSFILDAEAVGFDPKTKKYRPFEAVSQRIKRKYHIEKLTEKIPIELNIFDIMYLNGKPVESKTQIERRKLIEKIVISSHRKIKISKQFIVSSEKDALKFYKEALKKGEEGIMIKNLNAIYRPGRRVGYWVKMKPESKDLDFVIVKAEYGSGKRGGWLTSYILACISEDGKFLEVGKVASGLKEKSNRPNESADNNTTYEEMTKLLKPLIISEKGKVAKVKPKLIVSVTYQNLQHSPSYSSGYALRFPKVTHFRPDRNTHDIATLNDIKKEVKKMQYRGIQ